MTNMKNKSRMTVVMSLTGFPSKSGAQEMLVSFAQQGWGGKVENLPKVQEREGTVIPKVSGTKKNSQLFCNTALHFFAIEKR